MKNVFLVLVLIFLSLLKVNDSVGQGVIYGDDFAYRLDAPTGWVMDNKSGAVQGLHAVVYPKGGSWTGSTTVMYTSVSDMKNGAIDELISSDIAVYRKQSPSIVVTVEKDINLGKGKKAKVRYFSGSIDKNFEAVAYIPEKTYCVLICLSSKSEASFKTSIETFVKLVKSYENFSDMK